MYDKLLVATKVKKTIEYIEKSFDNCPIKERIVKEKIITSSYELLELVYMANIHKEIKYMKDILVKINMIDYYTKLGLDKKIINYKKYNNLGLHLLEIIKMTQSWIKYEKNKELI